MRARAHSRMLKRRKEGSALFRSGTYLRQSRSPSVPCKILGPHPSRTPALTLSLLQAAPTTGFCRRAAPAERTRCTCVCPRGCRLAVSWESRRVCTPVLEAVTLPCIAVLINRTSRGSPHLTNTPADTPLH